MIQWEVVIKGLQGARLVLAAAQAAVKAHGKTMAEALEQAAQVVETKAKDLVYAGRPYHLIRRTGTLQAAIEHRVDAPTAEIGVFDYPSKFPGAAVQELGTHIYPVRCRYLRFEPLPGQVGYPEPVIFARHVYVPPRPYLTPALQESEEEIEEIFAATLWQPVIYAARVITA